MSFLIRLTEKLEDVGRLIASRGSHIAALEAFYSAHTGAVEPSPIGVFKDGFPKARPGLVSIVILTLNGAELLTSLFRSFRQHNSWPDIEFIVVDHGGDAETKRVLTEEKTHFTIRHLIPGRNFSFAFSCNRAAQLARGETLIFLNNDIEFTEDVIPGMVAAVQATGGLAGLKLWPISTEGKLAREPQIGIRFRWNLQQKWTVPYEVLPRAGDELRATHPAAMPSVTAAILACPRDRFLALGGFFEDYLYAYEDVDFDLKAACAGMKSVSLNHMSARHIVGATRFLRARWRRRKRWHRYNLAVFRKRCGYLCRRLAWAGLFGGEGFDWGRLPTVAVIGPGSGELPPPERHAVAFVREVKDGFFGCDLYGYDLVISRDPAFDFTRARNLSAMAVRIGLAQDAEGWETYADTYDLIVAETEELAASLASRLDRPVAVWRREDGWSGLFRRVARWVLDTHRVAIIGGAEEEQQHLAAALRRRGMSVRSERAEGYPSHLAIRDDFAIWLEPIEADNLPPDTCHIIAHKRADKAGWRGDIYAGGARDNFAAWLELLVQEVEDYHKQRMAGPIDAPLESVTLQDDSWASAFWGQKADPTEWLIAQP